RRPVPVADRLEICVDANAGVVDDDVETTQPCGGSRHGGVDVAAPANVERRSRHAITELGGEFAHRRIDLGPIAAGHHDTTSGREYGAGHGATDAARASCDE